MSDFYAIEGGFFDINHGFIVRNKKNPDLGDVHFVFNNKSKHIKSLSYPYPTYAVSEETIREWAKILNKWVEYLDMKTIFNK